MTGRVETLAVDLTQTVVVVDASRQPRCLFCQSFALRMVRDGTSTICRGCGTIMPGEWLKSGMVS